MVQISRLIAGAALALALTTGAASSATVCGPHEVIVSILQSRFQEKLQGMGTTVSGLGMVELFVGPAPKKLWSIVVTDVNKLSCLTLGGKDWHGNDPVEGAKNAEY